MPPSSLPSPPDHNPRPVSPTIALTFTGRCPEPLAAPAVLAAFFATASYWLERDGWGTRFPYLLNHLRTGFVGPDQVPLLHAELRTVEAELHSLPVSRVVWDYQDTAPRNDEEELVNHAAQSLAEYFLTAEGEPLIGKLRNLLEANPGCAVSLSTAQPYRRRQALGHVAVFLVGCALAGFGLAYFPHLRVPASEGTRRPTGMVVWKLGCLVALIGAMWLASGQSPRFARWSRRHAGGWRWLFWLGYWAVWCWVIL